MESRLKLQPNGLVQQEDAVATPAVAAISFAVMTPSTTSSYPTENDAPCGGWRDVHNCSVRNRL